MNTLIKPPCCNGGPESNALVTVMHEVKPALRWVVKNYELIENNAHSWSEVTLIENGDTEGAICYSDICEAVRQYQSGIGAADIDEYAAEIVRHFKSHPMEEKSFLEIVADYADSKISSEMENVATYEECYDTAEQQYYIMCEEYDRDVDEIDEVVLKTILQDWAEEAMTLPIKERYAFIVENIEAGFY